MREDKVYHSDYGLMEDNVVPAIVWCLGLSEAEVTEVLSVQTE